MKNLIVVTGGAGFIGSNLINFFLENTKHNILSLDNYSSGTKKNHLKSNRVIYLKGETQNIKKILNIYKKKINAIFHFGEFARIYQSFKYIHNCFGWAAAPPTQLFLEKRTARSATPRWGTRSTTTAGASGTTRARRASSARRSASGTGRTTASTTMS